MSTSFYEKHKDAAYPSSKRRIEIMREVLGGEGEYGYSDHAAYPFVLKSTHQVLNAADHYLYRQYYLRDKAVESIEAGDTGTALQFLKLIGE